MKKTDMRSTSALTYPSFLYNRRLKLPQALGLLGTRRCKYVDDDDSHGPFRSFEPSHLNLFHMTYIHT